MVENNSLFRIVNACAFGILSFTLVKKLFDKSRTQLEDDIEKAANEFVESLKDNRDKVYKNATEECVNGIRKDLEDDVEKYLTHTREKLEVDVEAVLGSVRKLLEADIENNKRGNPADKEALIYAIDECLTDIKKLLKYDI